jgi:hypothetical protein
MIRRNDHFCDNHYFQASDLIVSNYLTKPVYDEKTAIRFCC